MHRETSSIAKPHVETVHLSILPPIVCRISCHPVADINSVIPANQYLMHASLDFSVCHADVCEHLRCPAHSADHAVWVRHLAAVQSPWGSRMEPAARSWYAALYWQLQPPSACKTGQVTVVAVMYRRIEFEHNSFCKSLYVIKHIQRAATFIS